MGNYSKATVTDGQRTELHDVLGLTGAEISVNTLAAGTGVPFVHAHKQNEEIYAILTGSGHAVIDGEAVSLAAGDFVRVSPQAKRQFFASDDAALTFLCIQVKAHSLEGYTAADAVL